MPVAGRLTACADDHGQRHCMARSNDAADCLRELDTDASEAPPFVAGRDMHVAGQIGIPKTPYDRIDPGAPKPVTMGLIRSVSRR